MVDNINHAFDIGELSVEHKHGIITLIQKEEQDENDIKKLVSYLFEQYWL